MSDLADPRSWQTVFKGADGSLLRVGNKRGSGVCEECFKTPPDGIRFRKCAGCMVVIYCGVACQRAAWPTHKARCRFTQKSDLEHFQLDPNASEAEVKLVAKRKTAHALLGDFIEAHRMTITRYTNSRAFFEGGSEGLFARGENQVLDIPLLYSEHAASRLESAPMDIDPSRAFKLGTPTFKTVEELIAESPEFLELWDASASQRAAIRAEETAKGNRMFVGLLMMTYQAVEDMVTMVQICRMYKTFDNPQGPMVHPCEDCAKLQMEMLLKRLDLGIVYRPDPAKRNKKLVPGYLRKLEGPLWRWTKLIDDIETDVEYLLTPPVGLGVVELLERRLAVVRDVATA